MKVTLRASTGAKILVWRNSETFHSQPLGSTEQDRACASDDLFEVLAELAGLDLDEGAQAAEAMRLADDARLRLRTDGPALTVEEKPPTGTRARA
jgi:hypothetical protein